MQLPGPSDRATVRAAPLARPCRDEGGTSEHGRTGALHTPGRKRPASTRTRRRARSVIAKIASPEVPGATVGAGSILVKDSSRLAAEASWAEQ